jgi:hypothetical protein
MLLRSRHHDKPDVTAAISVTFLGTVGLELWPIIAGLILCGALAAYAAKTIPSRRDGWLLAPQDARQRPVGLRTAPFLVDPEKNLCRDPRSWRLPVALANPARHGVLARPQPRPLASLFRAPLPGLSTEGAGDYRGGVI